MRHAILSAVIALAVMAGCAGTSGRPGEIGGTRPATVGSETGLASYYGHQFHGRTTASGEVYDENAMTAAHRTLAFGTRVRVINLDNGRTVELRITDRGPFVDGRIIDVSWRAARKLDFVQAGLVQVRVEILAEK